MPENSQSATHTTYSIERTRVNKSGLFQMPVAGPPPQTAALVRLHAPTMEEIIAWVAVREGAPPVAPKPEDLNPNQVLTDWKITGMVPVPLASGGSQYELSGYYVYAILTPEDPTRGLPLGITPVSPGTSPTSEYVPGENFRGDLLNKESRAQGTGLPLVPTWRT